MPNFQQILDSPVLTYSEGLEFFRGRGMLNDTLRRLARDLDAAGIEYSVIGAIALNLHGYHRFTEDIDVLLSSAGLDRFRKVLVGKGYRPAFADATTRFRETENNVPVEVIVAGGYPGDGKPKPIRFHDPADDSQVIDGIRTVSLERLIELKLASGMTSPGRLRDLADVQELIRARALDAEFGSRLDPYVREKFIELAQALEQSPDA
jgi:hypothetical protein